MNASNHTLSCPQCGHTHSFNKAGRNPSGSQSYRCGQCNRKFTPKPQRNGYPHAMREQAIARFLAGESFRAIARDLQVNHQTVSNWIVAYEAEQTDD